VSGPRRGLSWQQVERCYVDHAVAVRTTLRCGAVNVGDFDDRDMVTWAAAESRRLLQPIPKRWAHVSGVVRQAARVASTLPASERSWLVAAAYLHDIGWAPVLIDTGFHPLDGARWLRAQGRERLAGLVAYHSGAEYEAELRGLAAELRDFANEASDVSECLTYSDIKTGADGSCVTLDQRHADVVKRYGASDPVTLAMERSLPSFRAIVRSVELRMEGRR
jgi:HD domain-containing protein